MNRKILLVFLVCIILVGVVIGLFYLKRSTQDVTTNQINISLIDTDAELYGGECKNSMSGKVDLCYNLTYKEYEIDCIWKSVLLYSLNKHNSIACDSFSLTNTAIPTRWNLTKDDAEALYRGMCHAVLEKDVSYCNSPAFVKSCAISNCSKDRCVKFIENTEDYYNNKNPAVCNIINNVPAFQADCLAILNKDKSKCS